MREAVKLKKEAFQAWVSTGSPEAADMYRVAKRAAELVFAEGVEGIWGVYGEGLSVGLKGVLANHLTAQKGKAGTFPGYA